MWLIDHIARSPTAGILRASAREAEESIRVDSGTCCFTAKLVQFATRVVTTGQGRHAIQFGASSALEEYDAEGRWLASLPLKHRDEKSSVDVTRICCIA